MLRVVVSSWNTKHRCISAFFERYPTPSAFLDEEDMNNVKPLIKSLGLFDDRIRSLAAITSVSVTIWIVMTT